MNVNLLMLICACILFRYLAAKARASFYARFTSLLRKPVLPRLLLKLLRENPERWHEFRERVLPICGGQIALDATACAIFVVGVFCFPPAKLGPTDLCLLQNGTVLLVSVAFVFDVSEFWAMLRVSRGGRSASSDPEGGDAKRD